MGPRAYGRDLPPPRLRRAGKGERGRRILAAFVLCLPTVVSLRPHAGVSASPQRFEELITRTPLAPGDYLIVGFLGGRDRWNDDRRGVRKLALKLRSMNRPEVHVETFENQKRGRALTFVRQALDGNQDGRLDEEERARVRLILYGQSFGGAAVVKFARELKKLGVPVMLTVQVDSVGLGDTVIPSNVARAANLYQRDGLFVRGEPRIRAEDPTKTEILGNFQFSYRGKRVDLSKLPWHQKIFRTAHSKMDLDPEVWLKAEGMILGVVEKQTSEKSR